MKKVVYCFGHSMERASSSSYRYITDEYNYEFWDGKRKLGQKYVTVDHGSKPPSADAILRELKQELADNLARL
jgi:sirohydrochlorin ferrochelatase